MSIIKKRIINLSVFCVTTSLCIIGSELTMRKVLNFSQGSLVNYYNRDYIINGLRLGKSNTTVRERKNTGDYDILVDFNQHGLRDSRDVSKASRDSYLVVGDSMTIGQGIKTGERFSDLLFSRYNLDVYNLAIPTHLNGYKALLNYAKKLGAKSTRLILVVSMENDLFKYSYNQVELNKVNKSKTSLKRYFAKQKVFLTRNSALYYAITSAAHKSSFIKSLLVRTGLISSNIKTSNNFIEKDLKKSVKFIKDISSKYTSLIVIVPSRYNWVGSKNRILKYREEHISFITQLRREAISVLDLREKFEFSSENPLGDYHFAHDGHWNKKANSIAAKEIAQFLMN